MMDQLERCQKALSSFLEEKRGAFPRFYFIGDDDLLEILGQSTNPAVIQSHLKKLYQGVAAVQFNDDKTKIKAMVSAAGEEVSLDNEVATSNRVEDWLGTFTEEMKSTLASSLALYLSALVTRGDADLDCYPSQVLCVGEQVRFSDQVESANCQGLDDILKNARLQLEAYTRQDLTGLPMMQLKVKALVMDLIHNMDVLGQLDRAKCHSLHDWSWRKQLRYYMDSKSMVSVCMSDGEFSYSYEYQGNAAKLVHTPLTDRCYLTLVQGMHMGFGGNPYGPAGTGKTESVKALGNAFGRQVLVFNCFDESHQLLTDKGFMFLDEIKAGQDQGLLFATYDRVSKMILYAATSKLIVSVKTNRKMIEFACNYSTVIHNATTTSTSPSDARSNNSVSLVVTPDHKMLIQDIMWAKESSRAEHFASRAQRQEYYLSKPAVELMRSQEIIQFLTCAQEGLDVDSNSTAVRAALDMFASLGICPGDKARLVAFLEFYGFWLVAGFITYYTSGQPKAICSSTFKRQDIDFVEKRLKLLGVPFVTVLDGRAGLIKVTNLCYLSFFSAALKESHPYTNKAEIHRNDECRRLTVPVAGETQTVTQTAFGGVSPNYDAGTKSIETMGMCQRNARPNHTLFDMLIGNIKLSGLRVFLRPHRISYTMVFDILNLVTAALQIPIRLSISESLKCDPRSYDDLPFLCCTHARSLHADSDCSYFQKGSRINVTCSKKHENISNSCPCLLLGRKVGCWALQLKKVTARALLAGMSFAGAYSRAARDTIRATDYNICDQLVQLALHAGYSVNFTLRGPKSGNVTCWNVIFRTRATISPNNSKRSITTRKGSVRDGFAMTSIARRVEYNGRTWCVNIPQHHLLIVRRARKDCEGRVVSASVPTIQANCDEGIDFYSMGRIFIGLVKCGAWGCFDEFNRLKEDQLSAISQQIQVIQDAIKARAPVLSLMGKEINVDLNAGIFVTLNPAGKDYGGRSQIPDNLKALFRPVAMGRPDNELIAEVYLQAEGFAQAHALATKIVALFSLSKQLLTQQRHYDWGLRALKSVLNTGGKFAMRARGVAQMSLEIEAGILIKAVRVNTLSKLTSGDTSRFLALIGDVFPGVESSDMPGGELEAAICDVMQSNAYSRDETQLRKMLQLKEALDQRMGCVVVGPSGSGKSTIWRLLQAALIKCGQAVKIHVMNPKGMPRQQLLGEMDMNTREWTDGVLTDAARKVVTEPNSVRCWIVCDGDIDPEWIESLNSVLDDNHLLTLPNGERIAFGGNINFIFETHNVRFASPATVSRMGMIFVSDDEISSKRLVSKWLLSQVETRRSQLEEWLDDFFDKALDYVVNMRSFVVETTLVGTIMNGLSCISGVSTKLGFLVGLIRGLGGNLSISDRSSLAREVFAWARERPPDINAPLDCDVHSSGEKLFSYSLHSGAVYGSGDEVSPLKKSVIQTVSTQRTLAHLRPWIESAEPFLLVGNEGCGKDLMIQYAFAQLRKITVVILHCSARTEAADVIAKIQQHCSLFSGPDGRVYRPRDCERLVLYLKNLNLPKPDMYDTCMLIAFLQQIVTFGGFYDTSLEFLRISNIQIVSSINPATTVGRHPLSTRFTAVVRICYLGYPDSQELTSIYDKLLEITFKEAINTGGDLAASNLANFSKPKDRLKFAGTLVEIYEKVKTSFLVDDARHYLFTPRDLSAWVKNLLRYDLANEDFLEVVIYEGSRIFRDRMVDADSEAKLDTIVGTTFRSKWNNIPSLAGIHFTTLASTPITGARCAERRNDSISAPLLVRIGTADFVACVEKGLEYYQRENTEIRMLLFPQLLEHVSRVDRVISSPGGSLLLIGRSGVGRRTIVKLVSYMHGYSFNNPPMIRSVDEDGVIRHFQSILKSLIYSIAVEGRGAVLYVEDHHFCAGAILESINSLLSSGEVPGLFSKDELEGLFSLLREAMMDEGTVLSPCQFFVARVCKLLHVCVAMDPTNREFAARCESNPALFTKVTILWMENWCRSSMRTIPIMIDGVKLLLLEGNSQVVQQTDTVLSKHDDEKASKYQGTTQSVTLNRASSIDEELLEALLTIHKSASAATPRGFMLFLENWTMLYKQMRRGIETKLQHLNAGLKKLEEASTAVDSLSNNAEVEQANLMRAQRGADSAMEMITKTLSEATSHRAEVRELQSEIKEKEEHTIRRQGDIKQELSSIQPVLEAAKAAVGQIKAEHLNEIRSLKMPPEPIADVLGAVLKLLGISDVSWTSMKKFLGNRGVKDEILNYDARRIGGEMRKDVARLLKQKSSSFDQATITRVSVAAAPLAAWVKANIRYSVVLEKIQPLEVELSMAEESLHKCNHRLQQCEEEISTIDNRVAALKTGFRDRTREAEKLRARLMMAEGTLDKAQHLLEKLSGERERWQTQVRDLQLELASLPRKLLLAAGFLTYLSHCPEDEREKAVEAWKQLIGMTKFSLKELLASSESQLLAWKQVGLPSDSLSQENALIIAHNSHSRVPFVIDPADVARSWLQAHYGTDPARPLECIQSADARFTSKVELAVRFGKTLLIFDVDTLEPVLYPLARGDILMQGPRFVVCLGDKMLDYDSNFRLVLGTRNPRPDLPPDASALCTLINFTVTRSGLEAQLLGTAIQHEQPELEVRKSQILKQEEDYRIKLATLENALLDALATAEGDLLENSLLIESLTQTKEASREITAALTASAEASMELDKQREAYGDFSCNGSQLYFLIRDLVTVNSMYQFSLASFMKIFKLALKSEPVDANLPLQKRLERLTLLIEQLVFFFIGRGLFKADRCMFALHLVHGMHRGLFEKNEWELFIGELAGEQVAGKGRPRGLPSWAGDNHILSFSRMSTHLSSLVRKLGLENTVRWRHWAQSPQCERHFPVEVARECTPFQRVLITQCFRPDRLTSALHTFACEILQISSLTPPPLNFDQLYRQETDASSPIMLITTAGADPSRELADFASAVVGSDRFKSLAMGGGTQNLAMSHVRQASVDGTWLCLQNLHLVITWLSALEKALIACDPDCNFRLWLTTEPHQAFPHVLLQQSLKVTVESPPGTKKNVQRTLSMWGKDYFEKAPPRRSELFFCLAWLHAVLQERRTFIPQGWSKPYEFSFGDLRAGTFIMDSTAKAAINPNSLDINVVQGLMEDAIYGGRIDNPYDARVLRAYLRRFFTPDTIAGRRPLTSNLYVPNPCSYQATIEAVLNLADRDTPGLFGLPNNIERTIQRTTAIRVSDQLRKLNVSDGESLLFDREVWRSRLAPLLAEWQRITEEHPIHDREGTAPKSNFASASGPIAAFVAMENEAAKCIKTSVSSSLISLKKVVHGTTLLTPLVQTIAASLMMGKVPREWKQQWDGPEKPSVWLSSLVGKSQAIESWQSKVHNKSLLKEELSLDDIFRPLTFLNALCQLTARQTSCSMDALHLVSAWSRISINSPVTIVAKGLLLQGAELQDTHLVETSNNAPEITSLPALALGYCTVRPSSELSSLDIPLYHDTTREQLLVQIALPIQEDADIWILAGIAIFLADEK